MADWIKVRPNVAKILGLECRGKTADGNYLLWQADLQNIDGVWGYPVNAERVGGVIMNHNQAGQEHHGELSTPLPEPTDEKYREGMAETEPPLEPETETAAEEESEAVTETEPETEPETEEPVEEAEA